MKKIVALVIVILGVVGGGAAGVFLKPAPETDHSAQDSEEAEAAETAAEAASPRSFVKIGRQTIVPVVEDGQTQALMLFEIAVDVPADVSAEVHELEPKLRDAFLRELFRMSHTGAFMNNFTDDRIIDELRRNLTRAAQEKIGKKSAEVLILDVMRQEME